MDKIWTAITEGLKSGEVESVSYAGGELRISFAQPDEPAVKPAKRTYTRKKRNGETDAEAIKRVADGINDELEIPEGLRR